MDQSIELFSELSIELGDVKWDSVHKATLKVSDITKVDYWEVSCPCTKVSIDGNSINIEFNVHHATGLALKPGESSTKYRYIDFYLNPGIPEFIADEKTKKKIRNSNKESIRIPINFIAHGSMK
mgnify:CR=1 FL=1